ncbi:MAG: Trk system potassium transporter TrkA [Muribaculaceae bacterium]|nr:Trk system potassium transporter TrkA [Muribaculaceae bacterium]
MKIVIAGAGEVGSHLAKMLSDEEQDIIIMDTDEQKLAMLDSYNLMTYQGNGTSFRDLKNVRVGEADIFIAVTPHEARNLMACCMAKTLGARKTVARIDNAEYLQPQPQRYFAKTGVDELIYPEFLASEEIANALRRTWVRNWFEMFDGELIVIGVKLRSNSVLVGKRLRDVGETVSGALHVCAIKRNRETIIPRGDDHILENAIAYMATTRDHIDEVRQLCGKTNVDVNNVFIMGGSNMAEQLANHLGTKYKVKILESNLERCQELADRLPHCNIVKGDARDVDLLEEEGIADYDVFVALTESAEANILGCMMAKDMGVRKTVAEVENIQFISEAEALNIGSVINKKLLASSRIFQIMLDSDTSNAKCLALADAEVAELVVKAGSRVTRADVKDLTLSQDMTIAGVVRDGKGQLVRGNTRLQAGDHVVVFCLTGAIHKIEKLFN